MSTMSNTTDRDILLEGRIQRPCPLCPLYGYIKGSKLYNRILDNNVSRVANRNLRQVYDTYGEWEFDEAISNHLWSYFGIFKTNLSTC
jgi:hypothetical protein